MQVSAIRVHLSSRDKQHARVFRAVRYFEVAKVWIGLVARVWSDTHQRAREPRMGRQRRRRGWIDTVHEVVQLTLVDAVA